METKELSFDEIQLLPVVEMVKDEVSMTKIMESLIYLAMSGNKLALEILTPVLEKRAQDIRDAG